MVRTTWILVGLVSAMCFAACGDDGDDGGGDGGAGEGATGGTAGEAGGPNGGTATGGKATGGTSGRGGSSATGGSGGTAPEGGAGGESGGGPAGAGGEGGAACVPTDPPDEVCDDVDNDCNGDVDDIDVADDGIRDCLNIMLIGASGTFAAATFETWLEEQGTAVSRVHQVGAPAALTSGDFAGVDIAILDNLIRDYTLAESQVLLAWVRAGGGLMSMNGHTGGADRTRGNGLLVELGVEHLPGLIDDNVTMWSTHPLTTGLTSVSFRGGYALANLTGSEGSTVVASYMNQPVGLALTRGQGRAFVWGDEWVEFDSQWQSLPQIKQFWVNALGWLSGAR